MSEFEYMFFLIDLTPEEAAETLARALNGTVVYDNVGPALGAYVEGTTDYFGGSVNENIHAEDPSDPGYEPAGYDGCSLHVVTSTFPS